MNVRGLAITVLLAFALYYTYGQFVLSWMTVLPLVLAFSIFQLPEISTLTKRFGEIALTVVLFFFIATCFSLLPEQDWLKSVIIDVYDQSYLLWMRGLLACAAASTVALYLLAHDERRALLCFLAVVFFATASATLIIPTSPNAQIDVWTLHEQASEAFVHFKNPYTIEYTNIYPKELWAALTPFGVNFAYLPGVFIWMAPWKALGLDTRYSQVFAYALTALLLYLIARTARTKRDFITYVPALLFLSFPVTTFFLVRGWNDDISVLFFALAGYAMVARRPRLLFVACNCLFLSKQYAIIFVPFLIWFSVRTLHRKWLESLVFSTIGAIAVGAAYLIADWRNFLGSLYGLHFLKHPDVHQVFPDRTDAYSLMNWLHLYTGLKSTWFFVLPVLTIGAFVLRANWKTASAASLLRGLAAMAFALFIFAPLAYANYYELGLGLALIAMAASMGLELAPSFTGWEIKTNWWVIAWTATRALILFKFYELIIETRYFASVSELVQAGQTPYVDFNFHFLPFDLIPALLPGVLRELGDKSDFLAYHSLFQLVMLACDAAIAAFIFKRFRDKKISSVALAVFVFGPLMIAPIYLTSSTLISVAGIGLVAWLLNQFNGIKNWVAHLRNHPRFYFKIGLAAAVFCGLATGLLTWYFELEIQSDALLSPTHALIWMICVLGAFGCTKNRSLIFVFLAALLVSGFLFLRIESVFNQDSPMGKFVWIRNSLAAFSVILWAWGLYHAEPAANEV